LLQQVLITESDASRLVEVDRRGNIVWEYINPVRGGPDLSSAPVVSWGSRRDPNTLADEFRSLLVQRLAARGYNDASL
jgi:hypothetical protein